MATFLTCSGTTVTLRFAQALADAAARLGMAVPPWPTAGERVAMAELDRFWDQLCHSADPLIGLRLGLALQVGHLDITGLLLMSCSNYAESMAALVEYAPLIGGVGFQLHSEGELQQLQVQSAFRARPAQRVEAVLTMILQLSRSNTGGRFEPARLLLRHAPLAAAADYSKLLGCPVMFGAAIDALEFSSAQLALPLEQANPGVRDHLVQLADVGLAQVAAQSTRQRVTALLRVHPQWNKDQVAARLHLSGRHLARRLTEEGTSFRQLQDQERRGVAEDMLRRQCRIQQVAEALGFSDESAFAKAFRRWTGVSPSMFRSGSC